MSTNTVNHAVTELLENMNNNENMREIKIKGIYMKERNAARASAYFSNYTVNYTDNFLSRDIFSITKYKVRQTRLSSSRKKREKRIIPCRRIIVGISRISPPISLLQRVASVSHRLWEYFPFPCLFSRQRTKTSGSLRHRRRFTSRRISGYPIAQTFLFYSTLSRVQNHSCTLSVLILKSVIADIISESRTTAVACSCK